MSTRVNIERSILDRIIIDSEICRGRTTVRGTRITVEFVFKLMGNGYTAPEIVRDYPELATDDVHQCAAYGAWLASERWSNVSALE